MSYYLISALLIGLVCLCSFVWFERKHHNAFTLVILAGFIALAAVSRIAFIAVPFFKPIVGVVIIAALGLGAAPGMFVGMMSMLLSNIVFGYGPWTPYQMLAFGMVGGVFGLLGRTRFFVRLPWSMPQRIILSLISGLYVVLILGPTLDTSSVFMFASNLTPEYALAIYAAGLIPNAMLAAATSLTVALVGEPLLKQLQRLRVKLGVQDGNTGDSSVC